MNNDRQRDEFQFRQGLIEFVKHLNEGKRRSIPT
jgi:hypothetical protein